MAVQDLSKICSRKHPVCLKTHGVTVLEVDWLVIAISGFDRVLTKLKSRDISILLHLKHGIITKKAVTFFVILVVSIPVSALVVTYPAKPDSAVLKKELFPEEISPTRRTLMFLIPALLTILWVWISAFSCAFA